MVKQRLIIWNTCAVCCPSWWHVWLHSRAAWWYHRGLPCVLISRQQSLLQRQGTQPSTAWRPRVAYRLELCRWSSRQVLQHAGMRASHAHAMGTGGLPPRPPFHTRAGMATAMPIGSMTGMGAVCAPDCGWVSLSCHQAQARLQLLPWTPAAAAPHQHPCASLACTQASWSG
jgi:hypothetical protein